MSRKPFLVTGATSLGLIAGIAGFLALMIFHEPDFYTRAAVPPGEQRKEWSNQFRKEMSDLINSLINNDKKWGARFTEESINSYFEEDFHRLNAWERTFFPEGVRAPRVVIEPERIRLGFRYGGKRWSTIISLDLRVWVPRKEANVVAVEVQNMRIGALPIALQTVLERFSEAVRRQGQDIDMTWYRHQNKPVALLRFGSGRPDPAVQLQSLKLLPGAIAISGADRSRPLDLESVPKASP